MDRITMKRSADIYRHQHDRAGPLPYTLADLRDLIDKAFAAGSCPYCNDPLTPRGFGLDHRTPTSRDGAWTLENLIVCCMPCNTVKGPMTEDEYLMLRGVLAMMPETVVKELCRRLKAGASVYRRN